MSWCKPLSSYKLQEMYEYAWEAFYSHCSIEIQMAKLYLRVLEMEKKDGTYERVRPSPNRSWG